MDDLVLQAMAKWPHVPHCYGWLGLDVRGNWYLRDGQAQSAGPFASGQGGCRGDRIEHEALIGFIQRNYEADDRGRWFFQNGPQRVYVELECAPWVLRLWPDGSIRTHTGLPVQPRHCLLDETGRAYLATERGLGVVHPQDMVALADALDAGVWSIETLPAMDLATRFHFVISPQREHEAMCR